MTDPATNIREITKPRLVAALLSELDASFAVVLAECSDTGTVFNRTLQCEIQAPFESTEISIDIGENTTKSLNCVCCFGGQRLSFQIHRIEGTRWRLPPSITIIDLRSAGRLSFASKLYSAELILERTTIYGYAVDVNKDYLAVDIDSNLLLQESTSLRVIIRMVNTNCDIFYNRCFVTQIKPLKSNSFRVVLRLEQPSDGHSEHRRHKRKLVEHSSIQISADPFYEGMSTTNFTIRNISLGGMTISYKDGNRSPQLIPGMIVKSKDPDISYLVVWSHEKNLGIRPLLSEFNDLASWCLYIDRIAPPDDQETKVTRQELANILTHSGLLKGKRRSNFGRDLHTHMQSHSSFESMLLIQRRIVTNSRGDPVLYGSLKRYSECSWLYTDGASLTDKKGSFVEMVQASVIAARSVMDVSSQFPRYLTFIWHHMVKSSGEYAALISEQSKSVIIDASQISIGSLLDVVGSKLQPFEFEIQDLPKYSATFRRELSLQFTPEVFEALVGIDGSHPVLNAELAKHGPYHKAVTKVVRVENNFLIAHRIFTHNVWSTTGVTNSVFVLCSKKISQESIQKGLSVLAKDDLAYGTDDFLIFFDGERGFSDTFKTALPGMKTFSFLVHDLLTNDSLSFKDEPIKTRGIK